MDDLFFYSSKIVWMLISPDKLFVLLLLASLLLLLFNYTKQATVILFLLTLCTLTLSFFSIGNLMLYPLESRFQHNPVLPESIDGIIVLGGSINTQPSQEWRQLETNSAHERLSSFIELAHRYPKARLVFTGGSNSLKDGQPKEADLVSNYFLTAGIQASRLVLEDQSRNTAENAAYTKQLINPARDETWLLITSANHMPRSIGLFCQQNWPLIPYPVDHETTPSKLYSVHFNLVDNFNSLVQASYEWAGLIAYYLTGKIDRVLPSDCR